MNDTDALLGPWVQRFLVHHLVAERNLSRNTCKSYRDTFKLLVPFCLRRTPEAGLSADRPGPLVGTGSAILSIISRVSGAAAHTRATCA